MKQLYQHLSKENDMSLIDKIKNISGSKFYSPKDTIKGFQELEIILLGICEEIEELKKEVAKNEKQVNKSNLSLKPVASKRKSSSS